MILVAGATGTNGREVVARLSKAGHKVRALVRNPAKADNLRLPNVELVQGEFPGAHFVVHMPLAVQPRA